MQPGDIVAERFEIEELAGVGGMGAVYRARDRSNGARVAVKVLHDTRVKQSARFIREARLLEELTHPAIVRYVADGMTSLDRAYLAMEWLEGENLSDRLGGGHLGILEAVDLGRRVAEALGVAHDRGVIHRDLKPSNLFLVNRRIDEVRVIDFGIARLPGQTVTETGAMLGTVGYMAPEQARGTAGIDARADVFSLGAVLFRCLTGRSAFDGEDALAVLLAMASTDAPRLRETRRGVPSALDDLVARMLSRDPALRPRDGNAVAAELAALTPALMEAAESGSLDDSLSEASPRLAIAKSEDRSIEAIAGTRTDGSRAATTASRRSRRAVGAIAVAVLLTSLGGVFAFMRSRAAPLRPAAEAGCFVDHCEPLGLPHPEATDLKDFILRAKAAALKSYPGAKLMSAASANVEHGICDLSRHVITTGFWFRAEDAGPDKAISMLSAYNNGNQIFVVPSGGLSIPPNDAVEPACSSRDAWKAAVAKGLSEDVEASIIYVATPASNWIISVSGHSDQLYNVAGDTCACTTPFDAESPPPPSAAASAATTHTPGQYHVHVTNSGAERVTQVAILYMGGEGLIPALSPNKSGDVVVDTQPSWIRFNDARGKKVGPTHFDGVELLGGGDMDVTILPDGDIDWHSR